MITGLEILALCGGAHPPRAATSAPSLEPEDSPELQMRVRRELQSLTDYNTPRLEGEYVKKDHGCVNQLYILDA